MKIFLDFDDVLFNTRDFAAAYKQVYANHGISAENFDLTYSEAGERSEINNYQFDVHMEILENRYEFDRVALQKDIENVLLRAPEFIFSDVHAYLDKWSQKGYDLHLVSFGTPGWQDRKVAASGILEHFQGVHIGEFDKGEVVAELIKDSDEQALFLDDRLCYLESVKSAVPEVSCVLMQRPEARYRDAATTVCDQIVTKMEDVKL